MTMFSGFGGSSLLGKGPPRQRPRCKAILQDDDWDLELPCELPEGHDGKHDYLGFIE